MKQRVLDKEAYRNDEGKGVKKYGLQNIAYPSSSI